MTADYTKGRVEKPPLRDCEACGLPVRGWHVCLPHGAGRSRSRAAAALQAAREETATAAGARLARCLEAAAQAGAEYQAAGGAR